MTSEVPEEAIEAAAKSEWIRFGSHSPNATWETEDPEYKGISPKWDEVCSASGAPFHAQGCDEWGRTFAGNCGAG